MPAYAYIVAICAFVNIPIYAYMCLSIYIYMRCIYIERERDRHELLNGRDTF